MQPERLHILLLCYEYPPVGGGGGVGAMQYAEAWAAKGHEVTVLTSDAPGLARQTNEGGVNVVRVATLGKKQRATSTGLSMLAYLVSGTWHLIRHRGRCRRFEVLNTHFSVPTGPLGWVASVLLRRPNVLTIIGGDIYDPTKSSSPHRHLLLRVANRFLMKSAEWVVAISSDTKRRAEHYYGVRRQIEVINYGFQPPTLPVAPPPLERTGEYYLIAVGRLVERKGFIHLIQALALLPRDVRLLLVGDGPEEGNLREAAARLGVSDRVQWLGYQTREAIHGYLLQADCFVLSSLHEGLGIVVQEAMYAGLPIVATDEGGQVDLVHPERNGLLVKPGMPAKLAEAIERIHQDRALGAQMGRHNREDIERCQVGTNSELYLDVFRRLLHRPQAGDLSLHPAQVSSPHSSAPVRKSSGPG